MNVSGASAKPRFVYESFARRRSRPGEGDPLVVEGHRRQRVERVPGRVGGHGRVDVGRDEPEVGGGELPLVGVPVRVAQRLELLEVGEVADVDLHRQVAADRLLERLAAARGSRPGSDQAPANGSRARCQSSTCSTPSRTWRTTPRASRARARTFSPQERTPW